MQLAPRVKKSIVSAGGSKFTSTVNALSAKLSLKARIAMNQAVGVETPAAVAKAFLKANAEPGTGFSLSLLFSAPATL